MIRHVPNAFAKQPVQFYWQCVIPGGKQTHTKPREREGHGSYWHSSGTTLPHETRSPRVCGAAIPLLFPIPPPPLPLLLSGGRAERVLRPGRIWPGAPRLLRLRGHVALPKAALASKSMCRKGTCWKQSTATAKPTRSPTPAACSGWDTLSPSSYLRTCPWALATPQLRGRRGQPSPPQRFRSSFRSGTPPAPSPAHKEALASAQVPEAVSSSLSRS